MMENIAEMIANILSMIFDWFGGVDISGIQTAIETLTPYIKTALYFLPAKTIADIFSVVVFMWSVRLTIKTVKLVWDLLPIV